MITAEIKCSHNAVWPLAKFVLHPRNPNTHPPEQLRLLAKVIVAQGWRSPVVVSRLSGLVIKGHGRLAAAALAGLESAPVDLQDYTDEASELADLVADNRIAELAEIDDAALKTMLEELSDSGIDLEIAGFDEKAFDDLLKDVAPPPDVPIVSRFQIVIDCATETAQTGLLERFIAEGITCRALTL